jgi:hypothetical protein
MPAPSLIPLLPTAGDAVSLAGAGPFALGGDAAIVERAEDGWWLRPTGTGVELNGSRLAERVRLRDRDQILVSAGLHYEFVSGEKRTRRMLSAADMIARPRKRASGRLAGPERHTPWGVIAAVVVAIALVGGAAYTAWYGAYRASTSIAVLNDRQAAEFDSLLVVAYDHVERGGTLLELGLGDGAADEFAQAINTLALSGLRNHPQVKPRIEAIEATVASIYRERSLAVPGNYARATSPLTPDQLKTASLTADEFAGKFGLMQATFEARFGHEIVVSGRDHAEHVILYGKGGAIDVSIKGMTREEVDWIIGQAHAYHIRIKDFSQDSILRRQVARAVQAGLLFEAGTGLHLHMDRFANKHDRWTTLRDPSDDQELDPRHPGNGKLVAVLQWPVLAAVQQVFIHVGAVERRIDQEILAVLPDDRAVKARNESLRIAQDQVVALLGTL